MHILWGVLIVCTAFDVNTANPALDIMRYRENVDAWLDKVDAELLEINHICAKLTWDMMIYGGDEEKRAQAAAISKTRIDWRNKVCNENAELHSDFLTDEQRRKSYLLCRGPKYTLESTREENIVITEMQHAYNIEMCFNESGETPLDKLRRPGQSAEDYPQPGQCLMAEPDIEYLMKRQDFNPDQFLYVWMNFYNNIGAPMRKIFPRVVESENSVAQANGYADMGAVWRDELEIPDLEHKVMQWYKEISPLYEVLHAVVRHKLLLKYGREQIDPEGPLPIHLTGNMWGQNWGPLIGQFFKNKSSQLDLDSRLKAKGWTVKEMILQAEDFYTSLGLPEMTEKFWKYSIFEPRENSSMCHGTAANLFDTDDYRILLCAKVNMEDFYVLHHEIGHIEYNMAYKDQPTVFSEGTNSAFHESIGDVIMHGVMVPQHLHRLNLLTDSEVLSKDVDLYLLLQQALNKIPEIPFGVIVDEYRWNIFNGKIPVEDYNKVFWQMNHAIRGIRPPQPRSELYFDAGAKFHVPDNTPYVRYFLSSILQMQIFKGLCDISLYGKFQDDSKTPLEEDGEIKMPLHRCDIYGCKKCGKILEDAMALGASVHWSQVLKMLSGKDYITTKPLLEFYLPAYEWLKRYVEDNDIPIGW